jgi:hypothetical protein
MSVKSAALLLTAVLCSLQGSSGTDAESIWQPSLHFFTPFVESKCKLLLISMCTRALICWL